MTDTNSGVDLARVALRNARAAAKAQPQSKRRTGASVPRRTRGSGRDPLPFGETISKMVAERGWELAAAGGSILEQWPTIAPGLAGKVAAAHYDDETRSLHLRPKDSAGSQLPEVWQADAGQCVEKVGLCGANALRGSLGAGAKGAAGGHADHRKGGPAAESRSPEPESRARAEDGAGSSRSHPPVRGFQRLQLAQQPLQLLPAVGPLGEIQGAVEEQRVAVLGGVLQGI
ncbi:hypothetical protein [Streptomyces sp. BE133]|uniref:hypothetical protein n=1 Tax=Streptomyces sp. BE133 TaxID=3002523 RepID=UPI002E791076|nr:hypothetical protein [Streptomyces sp. BE133]MEE1809693.1 hypothetical protein [Streptomyces sp. BE133]